MSSDRLGEQLDRMFAASAIVPGALTQNVFWPDTPTAHLMGDFGVNCFVPQTLDATQAFIRASKEPLEIPIGEQYRLSCKELLLVPDADGWRATVDGEVEYDGLVGEVPDYFRNYLGRGHFRPAPLLFDDPLAVIYAQNEEQEDRRAAEELVWVDFGQLES